MRKTTVNNELMTTRQAGDALGVALRTVQLWVESGLLPAWRTAGGHRRIPRAAVEALVAKRRHDLAEIPAYSATQSTTRSALKLLVVEDDPTFLRLMATVVKSWSFSVELVTAENGFEGLMQAGAFQPDVLITDLLMPGMDGFKMLRALRKSVTSRHIPLIIVVSSLSAEEINTQGGLPKGVAYVPKPVHFGRLESLVRTQWAALNDACVL